MLCESNRPVEKSLLTKTINKIAVDLDLGLYWSGKANSLSFA